MKKKYTTSEYKKKNLRRLRSLSKEKSKKKSKKNISVKQNSERLKFIAPKDFRLFENLYGCLEFFRSLRNRNNYKNYKNYKEYIIISLRNVEFIDHAALMILTAIKDDLKYRNVFCFGDFPVNVECKKIIKESGFLNGMYDQYSRQYSIPRKSDLITVEVGSGKLDKNQSFKIGELIKNVVYHLIGEKKHCNPLKTVLLEICGNSIEHSKTIKQNWLLGVRYEENKVVFTTVDVGKGILHTLYKSKYKKITDMLTCKNDQQVLEGAFKQKYGSSTRDINRNKGLPSIKNKFEDGILKNLVVISNNVLLCFEDTKKSYIFEKNKPRFKGSFFQWEMTKEFIQN